MTLALAANFEILLSNSNPNHLGPTVRFGSADQITTDRYLAVKINQAKLADIPKRI
jgi:hypothetical protein